MEKIELLSPAGDFTKLKYALRYGADAVYLSGTNFGMRAACGNFDCDELSKAVEYTHSLGKKAYLTVNVMPHPNEMSGLEEYIESIKDIGIDAFIVADLGVMSIIKRIAPDSEIHISTQMSCTNYYTADYLHRLGAKRVVLARELSLEEIRTIRKNTSKELELEIFVHGAMCMAYSGRCFLSANLTGRDGNRGKCAQPCRWIYKMTELNRPDDHIAVEEFERGTAFFSSKDLCMIEHIPELVESGVKSLKIEGRVKSAYYAAVTANTYRIALDSYYKLGDKYSFDPLLLDELDSVSHREYDTGFFYTSPNADPKKVSFDGYIKEKGFLATVESYDENTNKAVLRQYNKIYSNSTAGVLSPGKLTRTINVGQLYDTCGEPIESEPHPQKLFVMYPEIPLSEGDIIRG